MNASAGEGLLPQDTLSELAEHKDAAALSAYLTRHPELFRRAIVKQLGEAVRLQVRVDVDRALRLADAALAIANRLDDAESIGLGTRAKANALWFKRDLKAAVELFQIAVEQFERADSAEEVGRTLSSSIQPLLLLGQYDRALEYADRAREIFLRIEDRWRLARLEINIANIHHRQSRFAEALASYQLAYEELQLYKDQEAMAVALHNMALCLIILNDFDRALATYQRARRVCEENDMPLLAAQADYNIAYLHFLRGNYDTAIEGLRAARELCLQTGDVYRAALCDLDQSEIYVELNLSQEAGRVAHRAQEQFEKLGTAFEAGSSVVNLAIAMHQQHESAKALELFAKAGAIFACENNQAWQALVGLYRALVLLETGHAESAVEPCREALEFFDSSGLQRRAILCHLLLARIAHVTGRLPEAGEHCQSALRKLAAIEAPLLSYYAHLLLGDLQRASGNSHRGYDSYQKARRELEALRGSLQGEELKIAFMKNRLDVYEHLVEICLAQKRRGAAEEAFGYMEQAKSRSLVELLVDRGKPLTWLHLEGAAGDRVTTLRQELNWYYRRLEIEQTRREGISTDKIRDLRAQARVREDALLQAIRELPHRGDSEPVLEAAAPPTLEEVRSPLGDDATLLEYFQVGTRIVAAVVTRRDLEFVQLGPIAKVASSMRMLEFQLSKVKVKGFDQSDFEQPLLTATENRLQELYGLLIAPLARKLKGQRLVVVPHSVLHYLPFHALSDAGEHLIDRFIISYVPSARIYVICHRKRGTSTGPALLLGVHDKRAPWIRQEIHSVAKVVPAPRILLGRGATSDALRTVGASSRFIHIATHGCFRRDNPMFSSVRLADSYLNIYDLYQLRLPAELIALSGCGTGLSVVASGDELLGLMRGLLSSGAESLLLTLWNVHDRTTARFMTSFYSGLRKHSDKGLALRDAMLDLRKSHPHPFYWAPFVLVGKTFPSSD